MIGGAHWKQTTKKPSSARCNVSAGTKATIPPRCHPDCRPQPSAWLYVAEAKTTSQARPLRCVGAHPAYLLHRRMPHCIGRFLRPAAPELVRAAQIHPGLSLCPRSLSDACRLLLSVNADHQALYRCHSKIMTCDSARCQEPSRIVHNIQCVMALPLGLGCGAGERQEYRLGLVQVDRRSVHAISFLAC